MSCISRTVWGFVGIALLGVAVWFRCWNLGSVPGVNGDEAWSGVQTERLLHGQCVPLRTPTGNPLNPFFLAPQVLVHTFAESSFAALRIAALASGLIALVLNFCLCRRAFGPRMAWLTTLIHAVLPINIAYSRFAWDASQSLLFTLPVVYAGVLAQSEPQRRLRWTWIGVFSLAAALIIHPCNLFVAPFLAIQLAAAWQDHIVAWWRSPAARRIGLPLSVVTAVVLVWPVMPRVVANVGAIENYTAFVQRFGDLFTGATVYEYIPGTLAPADESAGAAVRISLESLSIAVAGLAAFALFNSIRRGKSAADAWLVAGWAASVVSFFAVAGPTAIAPHFERYAICLVAPTVLLLGRALDWWMRPTTQFSTATAPLLLVVGAFILSTFKGQYFHEFKQSGGRSHVTFRTAAIEPKQQVMDLIDRQREPGLPLLIQTSEWWLYWPLQYLAYAHDDVNVELRSPDDPRPLDQQAFVDMETWIVEFAAEEAGWRLKKAWSVLGPNRQSGAEKKTILDAGGRELLLVIRLPAQSAGRRGDR
ncbi:MAG: hypothetical protein WD894_00175 [Pirellulales bacterium]